MVDVAAMGDRIETAGDLGAGDAAMFAYWEIQERIAEKEERPWIKRAREIVKRYRDERPQGGPRTSRFNILWSNVQTLQPTLYSRTPRPDVERRFHDQDPAGRLAAILIERCLAYAADAVDFDAIMRAVVEDRLLPGRGVARVVYVPHFRTQSLLLDNQSGEAAPGSEDSPITGRPLPMPEDHEVVFEEVKPVYVFWEDYREGPARQWNEVPWVRFRAYLTRDELIARFGPEKGRKVDLDHTPRGGNDPLRDDPPPDAFKKAIVHEVWDKAAKRVIWYAPGTPDLILDQQDDPLRLPGFFPNPDPLLATTTNDKRIPVPDFVEYQDQAHELDVITARIDRLTRALKVSGIYPGEEKQLLQQLIDEGTENRLIPVADWPAFVDKGSLANMIQWLPVQQIAETLVQLYNARDRVKAALYEITGIGDIMRGMTNPQETLGAVTWGGVSGSGATAKPTWQTALAPATANLGQPLAVAMAATGAGQFGWYQIAGTAVVAENATFAAASKAYLAGSGQLTTTQANGRQVVGAVTVTSDGTPTAGLGLIHMNRPFAQGQTV